jgi:hypothetical protein
MSENTRSIEPKIRRRYVEEALFAIAAAALLDPSGSDNDGAEDDCMCGPSCVASDDLGRVLSLSCAARRLGREHEAIGILNQVLRRQPDRMLGLNLLYLAHLYAAVGDVVAAVSIFCLYLAPERARPPADRDLDAYGVCASYASIIPGCGEFVRSTVAEAIDLARERGDQKKLDSLQSLARGLEQDRTPPTEAVEGTPVNPPGRNARCCCGSGRKYKKCCGHPSHRRTVTAFPLAA